MMLDLSGEQIIIQSGLCQGGLLLYGSGAPVTFDDSAYSSTCARTESLTHLLFRVNDG